MEEHLLPEEDGGSIPTAPLHKFPRPFVKEISPTTAREFICRFHYSHSMASVTKVCLGGFLGSELVAVSCWGYGVQPKGTLKKLFPVGIEVPEYLECGRIALLDELPRNSESAFLSVCRLLLSRLSPSLRLLFSWADGFRGKPGYIYQASSWWYGGFIWTDSYVTRSGQIVHPRKFQNSERIGRGDGLRYGRRPSNDYLNQEGWIHLRGKQFRYACFLGESHVQEALRKSSCIEWNRKYPKTVDLQWKLRGTDGKWGLTSESPWRSTDAEWR